jgi:hypothetical protein
MFMDLQDGITIGSFITELYFNSGVTNSSAIGKAYNLKLRLDKSAQDSGVLNNGSTDTSNVYEVIQPLSQTRGSLDVAIQDQYTEIINLYMCNVQGTTALTEDVDLYATSLSVANATGAIVGNCINISENGRVFQSIVTVVDGTTITIASGTDQAFTTNAVVCFAEWDFAQADGSTTPLIYKICPPAGAVWDLTKLNFSITDGIEMDDGKFGGITALTNGLIFRVVDGYTKQMGIITNNAGFREYGFDTVYNDRAGGTGVYGYNGFLRITDNGVVMRLNGDNGDEFQIIVRDNLTALTKLAFVIQGHTVE